MWPGMVSWGSICLRNPAKTPLVPKLPEVLITYFKKKKRERGEREKGKKKRGGEKSLFVYPLIAYV